MSDKKSLLPALLTARAVRSYINFDGGAGIDLEGSDQAQLQSKGVAALWHLLQHKSYAYLADEVGMGKTRQAFAVIATHFLHQPDAQVVVLCPGEPLQDQWLSEWNTFMRSCYKAYDDRVVSKLTGQRLLHLQKHDKLSEFAQSLLLGDSRIHLLRYSSLSRPLHFPSHEEGRSGMLNAICERYLYCLQAIGIAEPNDNELALLRQGGNDRAWHDKLTGDLNTCYAGRVATLVGQAGIGLIVADEAQYLRHIDNQRNSAITQIFRGHQAKWLFLSATPLHSGKNDIRSLDTYLCRQPDGYGTGAACGTCTHATQCTRASYQMGPRGGGRDVVELLGEFMVRRPRQFKDGAMPQNVHGKIAYRSYRRTPSAAKNDPFLALSMALVQKKLVHTLQGGSNRLKQGECSSFESLSASVARAHDRRELERHGRQRPKDLPETPDRTLIDGLNRSFRRVMGVRAEDPWFNLPHAKLNQVCETLAAASLRDGALHKTLVFTRRLDTVDEMVLLLRSKFQNSIDERLETWRTYLAVGKRRHKPGWPSQGAVFWDLRHDQNSGTATAIPAATPTDAGTQDLDRRSSVLSYFQATRDASEQQTKRGMLVTFRDQLLSAPNRNPLGRFLQPLHAASAMASGDQQAILAQQQWQTLLTLLLGNAALHQPQQWIWAAQPQGDDAWKQDTLKRCLLQSLRHSDFLVDLYILHNFVDDVGADGATLPTKLLWLFGAAETDVLPPALQRYLRNWKVRLREWIIHFDLIVDKCLRRDSDDGWPQIYANVDPSFVRMAPVMGRSGRLEHRHAVTQFNFPTYPNILICTDVLKEGVDMHLFCDHIVHYGVAWTSGDMEQRIGRIDRLGSLIGRRIASHVVPDGSDLPRLIVDFPYLEGTLDQYQVERVMLEKIKSDRRLDLGRHEKDIGEIKLDQLEWPEHPQSATAGAEQAKQYPDTTQHLLEAGDGDGLAELSVGGAIIEGVAAHLPALKLLVRRVDGDQGRLLRNVAVSSKSNGSSRWQQEYLVAVSGADAYPRTLPGPALADGRQQALSTLPFRHAFHADMASGTLMRLVPAPHPYGDLVDLQQPVWLERLPHFLLLRTPVSAPADLLEQPTTGSWQAIVPQYNSRRSWGYLAIDDGVVWLVCLLLETADSQAGAVLDQLSVELALAAARLRHLHSRDVTAAISPYRTTARLDNISAAHIAHFHKQPSNFMTTNIDDLQAHGRLLAGTQHWLSGVFGLVLDTLSNGIAKAPAAVLLLPGGVLHMRAEGVAKLESGRGQFQIEVYLQLAPADAATSALGEPRMIWQITANQHTGNRGPDLQLSAWEELPHNQSSGWNGLPDKHGPVYHERSGKRRSLVLYHAPAKWDTARQDMLTPWGLLMPWLMGRNFQREYAARAFIKSFGER